MQSWLPRSRIPVFRSAEAMTGFLRAKDAATPALAAYSSVLGGIVTDEVAMSVPIDDHGFHRGHCVFDTANVAGGKAFGLSMHLDRLLGSAQQARIDTSALEKDTLKRIILETIGATERRDGVFVRYWLTAGRGDFGISPKNCVEPSFYCVVHDDSHGGNDRGLSAAPVDVPLKPPLLATAKTNNYMINALVAMEAEAKGAQLGVQFEADGHLAESSVATIAVVGKDGILVSPPADSILASTTWARVRALAPSLVDAGVLRGCEARRVKRDELSAAAELLSLGGGWVEPITTYDGAPVGDGAPGPAWKALDEIVRADLSNPELVDEVPYLTQ